MYSLSLSWVRFRIMVMCWDVGLLKRKHTGPYYKINCVRYINKICSRTYLTWDEICFYCARRKIIVYPSVHLSIAQQTSLSIQHFLHPYCTIVLAGRSVSFLCYYRMSSYCTHPFPWDSCMKLAAYPENHIHNAYVIGDMIQSILEEKCS